MKTSFYRSLMSVCVLSLFMISCSADQDDSGVTNLNLDFEPVYNSSSWSSSSTLSFGTQTIRITQARFYVSNVTLIAEDGTEVAITQDVLSFPARDGDQDVIHQVDEYIGFVRHDQDETTLNIGQVPSGSYSGIRFDLGLRGLTNNVDPTAAPAGHPLEKKADLNNHWSWNSGYIFLRFEGYQDLDNDGVIDESPESRWWLHLGTAPLLPQVTLNESFTLESDKPAELHLLMDYAKLLQAFGGELPNTHTMNNRPQATMAFDAIPGIFEFHGVHAN